MEAADWSKCNTLYDWLNGCQLMIRLMLRESVTFWQRILAE